MVPAPQGGEILPVGSVPLRSLPPQGDQRIGTSADGGGNDQGPVFFQGFEHDFDHLEHGIRRGDGGASEFEYLHSYRIMAESLAVSRRNPS